MVFNKNGRNIHANVTLGGKSVTRTSKYCYLGVILTSSGSFQESQQDRYRKGLRALYCLKKEFFTENGANIKLFLKLADSIISPILCCNCEVWGAYLQTKNLSFHKFKENLFSIKLIAEKLLIKLYKNLLGANPKASNVGVYTELGRMPLHVKIYSMVLKFFEHLLEKSDNPLLSHALLSEVELDKTGKFSWFTLFRYLCKLCNLDIEKLKRMQNGINYTKLLRETFVNNWKHNLERRDLSIAKGHSELELYSRVKRVFGREKYVDLIWNSKARSAVTKIRISAHHFPIERGRYQNIERNDRVCTICDQNVMGNESHYVMFCSNKLMVEEREIFFEIYIK